MTRPPEQISLPLHLPRRGAVGREEFFVCEANAMAVALVEDWRNWPARKMVLCGPEGSGKTHLAHVWSGLAGAAIVDAAALPQADIAALAQAPVCVEDVERIAGDRAAEEALFHLHNLTLAGGHALLVTAQQDPALWTLSLPDLQSRMQGAQVARLDDPDDALLSALLAKLFADRELTPPPDVMTYLSRHMPRSHAAAQALVARLDAEAFRQQRPVSRRLAIEVLTELLTRGDTHGA